MILRMKLVRLYLVPRPVQQCSREGRKALLLGRRKRTAKEEVEQEEENEVELPIAAVVVVVVLEWKIGCVKKKGT